MSDLNSDMHWSRTANRIGAALHSALSRSARARGSAAAGVCAVALALSQPVAACPSCAEGSAARGAVLQDHFGRNLACTVLPFLIIGAVCAGVEPIGRRQP